MKSFKVIKLTKDTKNPRYEDLPQEAQDALDAGEEVTFISGDHMFLTHKAEKHRIWQHIDGEWVKISEKPLAQPE